ncbi:riboflavin kinase, putative [Trypanosoma equiperdum]|uniref:riboflavin kinase n=4 Tax=Trypanozoon TaxID=39700 RepID=Q38DG4_TRYB2|nr:riboflavin kinase, putative [Trypanosoma brucei gambiense DAL972]XP_827486.1 riboflavin kinase, putative [Trypanosoma brucei brucei TREU927]RHW70084.1 riboflavin kinase [Trypanosoma brucei equiperdum]SCU64419.1 riboflavin kinase, putative [Trypanosoma equiperdum]EAN77156.1 riboflavin kinase, putative [Trypanosoma brucei brucei TREU927]CBH14684.1 riboflavin kinase, putative [Trypanosoma brucei gambiense DAL972]|eukprot:XP_011776950.1 riboflavin kinase, putative [Trypanosoma brucei gambiense DAL972]
MRQTGSFQPFFLRGKVVHGKGRGGSQLGFPTANIGLDKDVMECLQPYKNLVVYGWGTVSQVPGKERESFGPYPFAASIGFNMQFDEKTLTVEPYFLHEFGWDFYGAVVKIIVLGEIRSMGSFHSLQALVDTIKSDVQFTRDMLQKPQLQEFSRHSLFESPSSTIPYFEDLPDE